jgi:uncharacterized protein (DUF58 family)
VGSRAEALAQRWSLRRQGIDRLPVRLSARRIYILPTRAGIGFAVLLFAILGAGLNYGNGLVLLLCFLLTGFVLTGLHQCHRRLLGLIVQDVQLEPGFAGGSIPIHLRLGAMRYGAAADHALQLRTPSGSRLEARGTGDADRIEFMLMSPATQRGRWTLPPLRLYCEAPMGLFRSWVWLHLDASTLVYPQPRGDRPLPGLPDGQGGVASRAAGHDEWVALRPFRDGDSPRQVAWKAYARGADLLSREWHGLEGRTHAFDFTQLAGLDTEARVSQLTAWVLEAERRQEDWSLSLPDVRLPAGSGSTQLRDSLSALALHGLSREASR